MSKKYKNFGLSKKDAKIAREFLREQTQQRFTSFNCSKTIDEVQSLEGSLLSFDQPGFFFGLPGCDNTHYIGMPCGTDANIIIVGGISSGKSRCTGMPSLKTWGGAICATDIKGELSDMYGKLYNEYPDMRPYIVLDPLKLDGPSYDPYFWLEHDNKSNLIANVWDIVHAIIPTQPDEKDPFWTQSEQAFLAASILYYFSKGLSFSQTVCLIMNSSIQSQLSMFRNSEIPGVRLFIGDGCMSPQNIASIERGLRNKLQVFAADPHISHIFRGEREGAKCFSWDDLSKYNIFLKIPERRIVQWSSAINLIYAQLISFLEDRPDKSTDAGKNNIPTLLLMDEFARFGKLNVLSDTIATLRSKSVNFCLMVQSIAQLDKAYGPSDRRIIFDNCQYCGILRANDPDTQMFLSKMVGTHDIISLNRSTSFNDNFDEINYGLQESKVTKLKIQPHEFATLDDVVLLTPSGLMRAEKKRIDQLDFFPREHPTITGVTLPADTSGNPDTTYIKGKCEPLRAEAIIYNENGGAIMKTNEQRYNEANKLVNANDHTDRLNQKLARDKADKQQQRRNYIIGELFTKYFPEVNILIPGTNEENESTFSPLEAFLQTLSSDRELVEGIAYKANCSDLFIGNRLFRDRNM